MSFIFNNKISYSDSPNIDAFGRLRTSDPYNLFSFSHTLTSGDTYFETYRLGTGTTATFLPNEVAFQLGVTNSGDRVFREQHGYNYYQPGKSQLILLTGVFGTAVANTKKFMGYMNDNDGLYFGYSGTTFGVGLRTSTSGSVVEIFTPQSEWNIDRLDTGSTLNPSGYHLDNTKANIYIINFQWLGVGRVVFALDIDGIIVPVHQILNANNKTTVYMKTGNLPIRYEVSSQGGTDDTFKQICASVISEGGQDDFGYPYVAAIPLTTTKTLASNTRTQLLSARLSTTFNGLSNRMKVIPLEIEVFSNSNANGYWELVLQRSHLNENYLAGTATWTKIGDSPLEQCVDGTTVTGGTVVASGFVAGSNSRVRTEVLPTKEFITLNSSGTTSDWLHLIVTSANANSQWAGAITLNTKY